MTPRHATPPRRAPKSMDATPRHAAAGYSRVSTDEQDTAAQRRAVEALALARGDDALRWYEDSGVSGTTAERPALRELLDAAHRGEVRRLYVYGLDRLTRRGALHALELLDSLGRAGCEVLSVRETWLQGDPKLRSLLVAMFATFAAWERDAISERTRAGLAVARAAGKRLGRPPADPSKLAAAVAAVEAGRAVEHAARDARVSESRLRQALRAAGFAPVFEDSGGFCRSVRWERPQAQKRVRGAASQIAGKPRPV